MASIDSGVETGNESNDGPLDVVTKNDISVEQVSTVSLSSAFSMLPENPFTAQMRMPGCIFEANFPPFKLPRASLPPGFGEKFGYQPPSRRSPILPSLSDQALGRVEHRRFRIQCANGRARMRLAWRDSQAERKLRVAVSSNNIEMVQTYLFAGVNANCIDSLGRSPLHLASCSGYSDIVRLLLENGANPNQQDRLGNTPLHLAACTNNIVVVTLLLKAGTDVCLNDLHGRSPLQLAQSKLKLLCKHMGAEAVVNNYVKNQTFQVSLTTKSALETIDELPVYDNSYVTNQALQIVEMMRFFLKKRGQEAEAELLSAFSSRLTLSETKEEVETQVRDLLDSLSGLSLDSSPDNQTSSSSSNSFNSICLFSSALPAPKSSPSCSFIPSTSSSGSSFQDDS